MASKKRVPVIAGNWKMFKNRDEALAFVFAVNDNMPKRKEVETVICAPAIHLSALVKRQGDNLRIGAQNMHFKDSGAFTGEISPLMLVDAGVSYCVIGHSERRQYFNETDETVNLKVKAAIAHDIIPILCVGESLSIREKGTTNRFVKKQILKAYEGIELEDALKVIVAYEPIWAIGTGVTATKEQANETIKGIRRVLAKLYQRVNANKMRILYGGSVNTNNIKELLGESDIDGALIGGASLKSDDFLKLVDAARK
ncbi:triose-phosphate isomerase [Acholeplasma sp. OttesenSCG-928-E16]|nr:triose-phosphate isomerase [Acholeplasma sp. OttesenSCG-928-E16]